MSNLLLIKQIPLTRSEKRRMTRETEIIIAKLEEVEINFGKDLFAENNFTYKKIYSHYLEIFSLHIKQFVEIHKPRFVDVNNYYFAERYAPMV